MCLGSRSETEGQRNCEEGSRTQKIDEFYFNRKKVCGFLGVGFTHSADYSWPHTQSL